MKKPNFLDYRAAYKLSRELPEKMRPEYYLTTTSIYIDLVGLVDDLVGNIETVDTQNVMIKRAEALMRQNKKIAILARAELIIYAPKPNGRVAVMNITQLPDGSFNTQLEE